MTEKRVEIQRQGFVLEGRLAMPEQADVPVPGVILLHPWGGWDLEGSHPAEISLDDRPIEMFVQLREAIVPQGVAVLRYNSRFVPGKNGAKPQLEDRTFSAMIEDVKAAVDLMRHTPGIDPDRIWLLGISLGTEMGIAVAEQDARLQGLILMAAVGENFRHRRYYMDVERKLEWLLYKGLVDASGRVDLVQLNALAVERWGWWSLEPELVQSEQMTFEQVAAVLKKHHLEEFGKLLEEGDHEAPAAFWQEWVASEPTFKRIMRFPGRVLIMQGLDDNTTPPREAHLLETALQGRANVDCKLFENLGHIFSIRKSDSRRTYGPLDAGVLTCVSDYLYQHTR